MWVLGRTSQQMATCPALIFYKHWDYLEITPLKPPNPMKKSNGLRELIISAMPREKKIDFIKRHDTAYIETNLADHSDEKLRQVAISIDRTKQSNKKNAPQS